MGSIGSPETSIHNYQPTMRNNPEERIFQFNFTVHGMSKQFSTLQSFDEAWSLTLREERRLKMFENRVLRRGNRGMEKIT
jgi:hypothetical protein